MRRLIRSRLTVTNVAVALGLFLAIGGVAYAAGGSSFIGPHGMINTCVPPRGGEVNVWTPGHRCSGGRVPLAWPGRAQNGAAGPAGTTGASGATGATGPTNPAATTVDGETVTKLLLKEPTPASGTTSIALYSADGLTILAACDHTGTASLQANGPASADSELTVNGFQGGASFGSQTHALGPASVAPLGPAGSGETSFSYADTAGQVISGQIGYQAAPSLGTSPGCAFFGVVASG